MPPSDVTSPTAPVSASRLTRPLSLLGLSFACILLSVIGGAVYAGYHAGLSQRDSQARATQTAELKTQYDLGLTDLAAGRFQLAAERFQFVLDGDPAYPGAADRLAEAQAGLRVTPTAAVTAIAPATPAGPADSPAEIFARLQEASANGDWDAVITLVTRLHAVDPDYEAVAADGLLFTALRNRGIARILGDAMEAGIRDLTQAEAFSPLDAEALNHRAWARLYLAAQSYWGLDWGQTVRILDQLYVLAPYFRDTSQRYYQATVNYARQLAAAGDACGAAERFTIAQTLSPSVDIGELLTLAQQNCALTPTPEGTPGAEPTPTPTP